MRQAVADAARHQEEEARGEMERALATMEIEMDHFRQEIEHSAAVEIELAKRDMDTAVQQIESDAAANIELAQAEMENMTWKQKEEAFRAADLQMAEERELWSKKEAQLQESLLQLQMIASQELKDQHGKLTSHYEAIIREKDDAAKAEEESIARTLREQAEGARRRTEELAVEVWSEACEKLGAAADEKMSQSLAMANEFCSARDAEMSTLLEERFSLRELLEEKEAHLRDSVRDMNNLERATEDAILDIHNRHESDVSKLLEEAASMNRALQDAQSENDVLRAELTQSRSNFKTLEAKYSAQREASNNFNAEVQKLSACKQQWERENRELAINCEKVHQEMGKLAQENDKVTQKNHDLERKLVELKRENCDAKERNAEAIGRANSLERLRREMEGQIQRKDALLAETLASIHAGAKAKVEPVVVHLRERNGDDVDAPGGGEGLSSECRKLRSRVLELQREKFQLENELGAAHHRRQLVNDSEKTSERKESDRLQQENNSLKTILSMMRKEMEQTSLVAADDATRDPAEGKSSLPSTFVLEQQLQQCRSYLDLLLTARDSIDGRGSGGDEIAFLRSKYRELHRTADELRAENGK